MYNDERTMVLKGIEMTPEECCYVMNILEITEQMLPYTHKSAIEKELNNFRNDKVKLRSTRVTRFEYREVKARLNVKDYQLQDMPAHKVYKVLNELRDEKKKVENCNSKLCIFEKRICRYANNVGRAFDCSCPSDDEMPCNK